MRTKLLEITLAMLLLAGGVPAGHAEVAERAVPFGWSSVSASASPDL